MLTQNQIYTALITDYTAQGQGVAHIEGRASGRTSVSIIVNPPFWFSPIIRDAPAFCKGHSSTGRALPRQYR